MKSFLIKLDDATWKALGRVVPARQRSGFVLAAIRRAIRLAEYEAMKRAYTREPDSEADVDDWSNCERFT